MREYCSPAVVRAFDAISPDSLTAANLLLELTKEEDGRTTRLLEKHGLTRRHIQQSHANLTSTAPLSFDRLVGDARALSREFEAEDAVTSDLFLLALLHSDRALLGALSEGGLNFAALERDVRGDSPAPLPIAEPIRLSNASEHVDAQRILDVNANRARESLRVLDDFCRFVLNDAFLTGAVKELRHDLGHLLDLLPAKPILEARETVRDIGTSVTVAGEMVRESARDVARVNWKRLQESLRSLEEFGKVIDPDFAAGVEQLRYRSYTLEKALLLGADSRERLAHAQLYVLLTAAQCVAALDWTIAEAAAGGASIFQLREKELDDRRLLERARDVRKWTRQAGALFIVNDRPDIARLSEADGVHLGQDDMPVHEARRILGPDALIGVSTHNIDQVRRAALDGANYIGIGPTFPSTTKSFDRLAGLEFIRAAIAETSLPAFAIGGIHLKTIDAVAAAGATRVAVGAAIVEADEPQQTARTIRDALRQPGEHP